MPSFGSAPSARLFPAPVGLPGPLGAAIRGDRTEWRAEERGKPRKEGTRARSESGRRPGGFGRRAEGKRRGRGGSRGGCGTAGPPGSASACPRSGLGPGPRPRRSPASAPARPCCRRAPPRRCTGPASRPRVIYGGTGRDVRRNYRWLYSPVSFNEGSTFRFGGRVLAIERRTFEVTRDLHSERT